MRAVVDTNVVAYLLLGADADVGQFGFPMRRGHGIGNGFEADPGFVDERACGSTDTLFVELASRAGAPLVTFDRAVLRAFPDVARRPRDL